MELNGVGHLEQVLKHTLKKGVGFVLFCRIILGIIQLLAASKLGLRRFTEIDLSVKRLNTAQKAELY